MLVKGVFILFLLNSTDCINFLFSFSRFPTWLVTFVQFIEEFLIITFDLLCRTKKAKANWKDGKVVRRRNSLIVGGMDDIEKSEILPKKVTQKKVFFRLKNNNNVVLCIFEKDDSFCCFFRLQSFFFLRKL